MKKLLLLVFLMTISLGQSQSLPLDFSDPSDLMTGMEGSAASIVQDNGDSVLQIVVGTGTWDHAMLILAQNLDLSESAQMLGNHRGSFYIVF